MPWRVILVAICLCMASTAFAQQSLLKKKLHSRAAKGNAHELLRELNTYAGIAIEYSPSYLDTSYQLTITEETTTLGKLLNKILKGQRVTVIEKNNKILIGASATPLAAGALLDKYVLFGFIQQENSQEPLPFATIRESVTGAVAESNIAGFYTMNLSAGAHVFEVSYTGFNSRKIAIDLDQNTRFNCILSPDILPEINVNNANALKRDAGNKLNKEESGTYSNLLGATDPVRAVYLLPGNSESQESGGKLIVRGGEPGQSIYLLDGNQIFNPAHLLGEISIVNNTSVKAVRQFKNDFPGEYSGGIAAITAIHTKDGNMEKWSGEAALGFSSGALRIEGPLSENRTALMVSARHSLGDASNKDILNYDAQFSDLHVKLTTQLNSNNKLLISGYTGSDHLQLTEDKSDYLQKWNNKLFTVNWNLLTGKRSFVNTTVNVSNFDNYVALKYMGLNSSSAGIPAFRDIVFNNYSAAQRVEAKTAWEITASPYLKLRFGGKYEYMKVQPYATLVSKVFEEEDSVYLKLPALPYSNIACWYENEIRIGNNLLVRPGIHMTAYSMKAYKNNLWQPRLFAAYRINNQQQLTLSYSHMAQVLHQVTSPYPGINREVWLPANKQLQPALSKMINVGYQYRDPAFVNWSVDVYYKRISNVVNFSEKANILYYSTPIESKLITGKGESYGAEWMAEKKIQKVKAQLSYTLAWSWRQFDSVNNGRRQPFRYDRRHNLNLLLYYQPANNFGVSVLWHLHTGDWITIPSTLPANPNESMNNGQGSFTPYRGKAYNRININTTLNLKPLKRFRHKFSAGVHMMDQASQEDYTRFSTTDNNSYDVKLNPDQLFRYSWYVVYNISF